MLVLSLLVSAAPSALADTWEDEAADMNPGKTVTSTERVPLRFVRRPLTLPDNTWGLIFDAGYTQLSKSTPLGAFNAGAGFGVTDDAEVGVLLLLGTFSPDKDSGLESPRVFGKYRLSDGDFELAAKIEFEIPLGQGYSAEASLPILGRIADVVRIDLEPAVEMNLVPGVSFIVKSPLRIGFQIIDSMRLSVGGHVKAERFGNTRVLGNLSAGVSYAFSGDLGAFGDVSLEVTTPNYALYGQLPEDPSFGNYWSVFLYARFFIEQEPMFGRIGF